MMAMRWQQQWRPCINIEVRGNPESTVYEKMNNMTSNSRRVTESNHRNGDWGPMVITY
jgi:hypothetical protein